MTEKEAFIKCMNKTLDACADFFGQDETAELALKYYNSLKTSSEKEPKIITEKGAEILKYLQESNSDNFSAKSVGEGVGKNSKVVSGAMKKLTSDGFLIKVEGSSNPVLYKITEKGRNFTFDK